jgi:hypothetical protein
MLEFQRDRVGAEIRNRPFREKAGDEGALARTVRDGDDE